MQYPQPPINQPIGWLPKEYPGHYLYIRPAMIGTGGKLGYKIPTEAMLFILMTPYKDLSKSSDGTPLGLRLVTSPPNAVRAWPGGFGYAKLGANYGPSLERHQQASAEGFDQILWLFGPERLVTEAGASNLFVIWDNKETGRRELVTPGLQNKLILSGITRRSVLELANLRFAKTVGSLAPLDVCEKDVSANELEKAWAEGRLLEAFLVGTAVSIFLFPFPLFRTRCARPMISRDYFFSFFWSRRALTPRAVFCHFRFTYQAWRDRDAYSRRPGREGLRIPDKALAGFYHVRQRGP